MRSSASPPSQTLQHSASRLKEELALIKHRIHKTSVDHNIANDSGVSLGSGSEPSTSRLLQLKSPPRQTTGSSIASTITPESLQSRSSTLTAEPAVKRAPPSPESTRLGLAPPPPTILTQFGPSLSGTPSSMTASPSILKSNDIFFAPSPSAHFAQSPSSNSLDAELDESWASLARELKPIADIMRTGRHRTTLGASPLPLDCISALQLWLNGQADSAEVNSTTGVLDGHIEIFRVLANLCIDHDRNRTILNDITAAPVVLSVVSAWLQKQSLSRSTALFPIKVLSLLRAAMGAVLNMQLEHIATRQSLATSDCLSALTRVASHPRVYTPNLWQLPQSVEWENDSETLDKVKMGAMVSSWAWRIVQEVHDDAKEEKNRHNRDLSNNMNDDDDDDDEENHDVRAILSKHCFDAMLSPLLLVTPCEKLDQVSQSSQPLLNLDSDDVDELVEADTEILQIVGELIEGCAGDDHGFRTRAVSTLSAPDQSLGSLTIAPTLPSALQLMMTFVEHASVPSCWQSQQQASDSTASLPSVSDAEASAEAIKVFSRVKSGVARAVVTISGDDSNMEVLFDSTSGFIDRLKTWIRYDPKVRDDLVSCGMLALGNLARSDAKCISLVQTHDLAPFLASLLSQATDIKVAHGLVSLLKNLSIPTSNKTVIGRLRVVDAVIPFMGKDRDMVQPLQFGTVGLLKHLCAGVLDNAIQFVGGDSGNDTTALNALVDMIRRIDDVPTKMEATRVLVNVVKSLWSSSTGTGVNASASEQLVGAARRKVTRRDVIQALAEMVRTSPKYPVLVNEGILALTLVGTERSGAELVSLSLLSEPSKVKGTSLDGDESDVENEGELRGKPKRKSTGDSTASSSSNPLPPPATAMDMVNSVLSRRDARMPPQFASNACVLVLTLTQSHASQQQPQRGRQDLNIEGTGAVGQMALLNVAKKSIPALERLASQGPTEALQPAARALEAVRSLA
ncbi:hypothetical protein BCV70DRAFT_210422 [Testicularia cyperi]|uniref:ARM repeat-containing protein n=1 Tax=Testicularia cyperi TaxID=1882483 RepID=A0A317XWG6_9BASI|nr:hypothetical protein BCV70DRAFT_210422 [Testicularia cyperi]